MHFSKTSNKSKSVKKLKREHSDSKVMNRDNNKYNDINSNDKNIESADKNYKATNNSSSKRQDKPSNKREDNRTMEKRTHIKSSSKRTDKPSNNNYEYCLDNADQTEKDLILNGTINDKLNCLALLCARNPTDKNYKQLLQFCENQRNDVIYSTLKLVRDLIKDTDLSKISDYIKSRIIKSFEMGSKNQYIKNKVDQIIGVLCRAGIYSEDFINILISRLIEKGETLKIVEDSLKSLIFGYEKLIFDGIEDFYYKNDTFRFQYNILKFLQNLEFKNIKDLFNFYNNALSSLDSEYSQIQKDLMMELLVNGLSKAVSSGDSINNLSLIRNYIKSPRSVISVLNLLIKTKDSFIENYILKVCRTTILRNTKQEPEFLNMIYKLELSTNLYIKLVDNSFYCSISSILGFLLMAKEKEVEMKEMFSINLLSQHYSPIIRDICNKLIKKEKIPEFDPFDSIFISNYNKILSLK